MAPFKNWDVLVLKRLGVPVTPQNRQFLAAWQAHEGGGASFNPLNTTQPAGGASSYNSVGVRNYRSPAEGLQATVQTLRNGHYGALVAALKTGNPRWTPEVGQALSTWGTGSGFMQDYRATPIDTAVTPQEAPGASPLPGGGISKAGLAPFAPDPLEALHHLMQSDFNPLDTLASTAQEKHVHDLAAAAQPPAPALPGVPQPPTPGIAQDQGPVGDLSKWVIKSPTMDRAGVLTKPQVFEAVARIAQIYGRPLTIGTGSNHHQIVSGQSNVSDHWYGEAADIPMTGGALTRLGQDALIMAGADPKWARRQKGGVYNIGGYNILFNTHVGGNHFNHLHVGMGRILGRK